MDNKEKIKEKKAQITLLINDFCAKKLNEEYAGLCTKLLDKLGRKRDVPFVSGKPEIWAVGIIHAIGTLNDLFDKDSKPFILLNELNDFFGTGKSSMGMKSKFIRDLLNIKPFDPEFCTEKKLKSQPSIGFKFSKGVLVSFIRRK